MDFSAIEITSKKVREIKWILRRSKLHRKKFVEKTWIFRPAKLRKKSTWKRHGFFNEQNYIEKISGNDI